MQQTQTLATPRSEDLISPLISTIVIVLFLFYIDEGYYNFKWMAEWGNWLVFGIYLLIFYPIQWAISHFLFSGIFGWKKAAALVGLTIPSSFLFFWLIS